jgi:tetratricopeptide (TPR) repeat protein
MAEEVRMPQPEAYQKEAEGCVAEADCHQAAADGDGALDALRRAVLLFAAADASREAPDKAGPYTHARARTCHRFADSLAAADRHAEAANIYQEATDQYGLIADEESRSLAAQCARRVLDSIAAVRERPQERLHLLVAHYERVRQQLALEPGTEPKQADCSMHIGRIYQRRDRPTESAEQYRQALALLSMAPDSGETALAEVPSPDRDTICGTTCRAGPGDPPLPFGHRALRGERAASIRISTISGVVPSGAVPDRRGASHPRIRT